MKQKTLAWLDGKPLACCKGLGFYRYASIMDFFSTADTNLYTLVVKINNILFNFILSGRDTEVLSATNQH